MSDVLLVFTNCPDAATAEGITRALIENRQAACVNQLAPVASVYHWQGAVETATEIPLLIKCTRERYPAVEQTIRQLHPSSIPEIVAVPVAAGYGPYLRWVDAETQPPMTA